MNLTERKLAESRKRGARKSAEARAARGSKPRASAARTPVLNQEPFSVTELRRCRKLALAVVEYNVRLAAGKVKTDLRRDPDGTPEKAWAWLRDKKRSRWWCQAAGVRWEPIVDAVGEVVDP